MGFFEMFVLYLVVSIERVSAAFLLFSGGVWAIPLLASSAIILGSMFWGIAAPYGEEPDWGKWRQIITKPVKWAVIGWLFCIFMTFTGKLMPNQKEMMMIAGGAVSYTILTSEPAKELGSRSLELLLKEIDSRIEELDNTTSDGIKLEGVEPDQSNETRSGAI